jgi:MFS superfamily sulfate permease-like transporter
MTPQGYTKPMRLAAALKFTFLTGVFQIGLGVFRLGAIVHYVSYPVMVACNSAGAYDVTCGLLLDRVDGSWTIGVLTCTIPRHNNTGIIITIISQLKYFLGIKVPSVQYTYQVLEHLFTHLGQT